MGLFNFFKRDTDKRTVSNSIGEFRFSKERGMKIYKGKINSKIGNDIEVKLEATDNGVSEWQVEYFKQIENNWESILQQFSTKKPDKDFKAYKPVVIFIPEKGKDDYDAEIVILRGESKEEDIFSLILVGLNIDEVI